MPSILYHYTNEDALVAIVEQEMLQPSLLRNRRRDVRYGEGQYLTDVAPGTMTGGRLASFLVRNAREAFRFTHFLALDVAGLTVTAGRKGIYVVSGTSNLDLAGRIIRAGGDTMTYLKVTWTHDYNDEPVKILSELDEERYEIRRVEQFRDGSIHILGPEGTGSEEYLAENPMPLEQMIELTPSIRVLPTSQEEFEQLWQSATIS